MRFWLRADLVLDEDKLGERHHLEDEVWDLLDLVPRQAEHLHAFGGEGLRG